MAGRERGRAHRRALPVSAGPAVGGRTGWGALGSGAKVQRLAPKLLSSQMARPCPSCRDPVSFQSVDSTLNYPVPSCVMFDFADLIRVPS